jgi:hypothetical protein
MSSSSAAASASSNEIEGADELEHALIMYHEGHLNEESITEILLDGFKNLYAMVFGRGKDVNSRKLEDLDEGEDEDLDEGEDEDFDEDLDQRHELSDWYASGSNVGHGINVDSVEQLLKDSAIAQFNIALAKNMYQWNLARPGLKNFSYPDPKENESRYKTILNIYDIFVDTYKQNKSRINLEPGNFMSFMSIVTDKMNRNCRDRARRIKEEKEYPQVVGSLRADELSPCKTTWNQQIIIQTCHFPLTDTDQIIANIDAKKQRFQEAQGENKFSAQTELKDAFNAARSDNIGGLIVNGFFFKENDKPGLQRDFLPNGIFDLRNFDDIISIKIRFNLLSEEEYKTYNPNHDADVNNLKDAILGFIQDFNDRFSERHLEIKLETSTTGALVITKINSIGIYALYGYCMDFLDQIRQTGRYINRLIKEDGTCNVLDVTSYFARRLKLYSIGFTCNGLSCTSQQNLQSEEAKIEQKMKYIENLQKLMMLIPETESQEQMTMHAELYSLPKLLRQQQRVLSNEKRIITTIQKQQPECSLVDECVMSSSSSSSSALGKRRDDQGKPDREVGGRTRFRKRTKYIRKSIKKSTKRFNKRHLNKKRTNKRRLNKRRTNKRR